MKKTTAGLPNTCAKCGDLLTDEAYAVDDEQARAGQVFCAKDAGQEKEAAPAKKVKTASKK